MLTDKATIRVKIEDEPSTLYFSKKLSTIITLPNYIF